MSRKYSIEEIDAMRNAICILRSTSPLTPANTLFNSAEENALVEGRLRTYMQNGTDPEELERAAEKEFNLKRRDLKPCP